MKAGKRGLSSLRQAAACVLSLTLACAFVPMASLAYATDDDVQASSSSEAATTQGASEEDAKVLLEASALAALAEDEADGTVSCANGWELYYTVSDDGVTISGVSVEGTGELTIPASIDGQDVVAIGNSAFVGCSALGSVVLPDTVSSIGLYAFMSSSVTSINIPAAVERITFRCFRDCTSLTDIAFQGSSLRYLSQQSFYNCSSLTHIEVPLLTDSPSAADVQADGISSGSVSYGAAVGANCFANCTSLSSIVFDGPVRSDAPTYFVGPNCIANCASDLQIICKCATVSIPSGTGSNSSVVSVTSVAHTLDFYSSAEDAANYANCLGSITAKTVDRSTTSSGSVTSSYNVQLFSLIYGTQDYSDYVYEGSVPECPEGKVWGIVDGSSLHEYSYMTGSYQVVAVDPEDVSYGWVSSPSISEFNSTTSSSSTTGMNNNQSYATLYMEADGSIPELDELAVYASDGTKLDDGAYTLVFEQASVTYDYSSGTLHSSTEWEEIDEEAITEAGMYRVHGVGTGDYGSSATDTVTFNIVASAPEVTTYYNSSSMSNYLGLAAYDAAKNLSDTPAFNVVVPANTWQNQLLGAGFAGAAGGLVLADCDDDYSYRMTQAAMLTNSDSFIIMGSSNDIKQSTDVSDGVYLSDFLAQRTGTNTTRYGEGATTAQELATAAIGKFKAANWGAEWGEVAVVASSTEELVTEAAAQYVYGNAARVFFLDEDGALSDSDLSSLASSDITQIVLVGDTSCVSSTVANSIASSTGKTPTRILDGSTTAASASMELAQQLVDAGSNNYDTIVIADATQSANVSNAAVLAETAGGVMITCRTTADAKAIEALFESLIASDGLGAVSDIRLVGAFDYLDDAETYFTSAWGVSASDLNTTGAISLEVGDAFEVSGVVYQVTGTSSVMPIETTGSSSFAAVASTISYAGTTFSVSDPISFSDVAKTDWFYDAVAYSALNNIVNGYTDDAGNLTGVFGSLDDLTREQFVTILWRYAEPEAYAAYNEKTSSDTTGFDDAVSGTYYTEALNWAKENGVTTGISGTNSFGVGNSITFQDMIVMIYRYVGEPSATADLTGFSDYADIHQDYAIDAMTWGYANGVYSGYDDGSNSIKPNENVYRARAVQVIYNSIKDGLL